MPSFLCQLTFPDNEYRVNKQSKRIIASELNLSSAATGLLSTNLLASVYPNNACQLNWHDACLDRLPLDWLVAAGLHLNTRIRHSRSAHTFLCFLLHVLLFRLALAAITRVDLSNNRLVVVPHVLFQLQSLRVLNLDRNCIARIELPPSGNFQAACLEQCSMAGNYIVDLPKQVSTFLLTDSF